MDAYLELTSTAWWHKIVRETGREFTAKQSELPPSTQLYDYFPSLSPFFAEYEKQFACYQWPETFVCLQGHCGPFFFMNFWWIPFVLSALYVVGCFGGRALMAHRDPFSLRWQLSAWNLFLAIFSLVGAVRVVPQIALNLYLHGFEYTICERADTQYGIGASGLWVVLFILSKPFELFDTVFIVLRKKPLRLLHWYHHISVMIYCWHSYGVRSSNSSWFVGMNYCVHAIMYLYYFLTSIGIYPKWGKSVTYIQLSQMVVGIVVQTATYFFVVQKHGSGESCDVDPVNIQAGFLMYFSYFLLFLQILLSKDYSKKDDKKSDKKEQ